MRFTVRRPPNGEVSPCGHRPSGGDVACCVHIGVTTWRCAGDALEDRLALAVVGSDVPTHRASLRRVRGRDLFDTAGGLILQPHHQKSPCTAVNGPVQPTLVSDPRTRLRHGSASRAGHRGHVKGFDPDHVEAARYVRGCSFDPVLAAVRFPRLPLCNRQSRTGAPVGTAPSAREAALQHPNPCGLALAEARSVQQFPGRKRRRHHHAAVDAHHAAVARASDRVGNMGERDMPAASPIPSDPVGLDPGWHRPRQTESHPADLGHPDLTEAAVDPAHVRRFHRDLAESLVHPGLTPRRSTMRACEEVAHRLREVPQRLLLHSLRTGGQPNVLGAGLGELCALLVVAWRSASWSPTLLLFDGQIPHISGVTAMLGQEPRLIGVRQQPISRHRSNITATTDTSPKGEAALPAPAHAWHLRAATIR